MRSSFRSRSPCSSPSSCRHSSVAGPATGPHSMVVGQDVTATLRPATRHRAVLSLTGAKRSAAITDTDPGSVGEAEGFCRLRPSTRRRLRCEDRGGAQSADAGRLRAVARASGKPGSAGRGQGFRQRHHLPRRRHAAAASASRRASAPESARPAPAAPRLAGRLGVQGISSKSSPSHGVATRAASSPC